MRRAALLLSPLLFASVAVPVPYHGFAGSSQANYGMHNTGYASGNNPPPVQPQQQWNPAVNQQSSWNPAANQQSSWNSAVNKPQWNPTANQQPPWNQWNPTANQQPPWNQWNPTANQQPQWNPTANQQTPWNQWNPPVNQQPQWSPAVQSSPPPTAEGVTVSFTPNGKAGDTIFGFFETCGAFQEGKNQCLGDRSIIIKCTIVGIAHIEAVCPYGCDNGVSSKTTSDLCNRIPPARHVSACNGRNLFHVCDSSTNWVFKCYDGQQDVPTRKCRSCSDQKMRQDTRNVCDEDL